ncbi:hypothetical protein DPMN_129562 [Dreissena polymorpha]|uniref:Uncharacterized protein n=1 Tax=Dreissena polymorpha TaxID=45954 RepID=A0A9D4H3E5_DREPO|nr:hypothetical protein DPMN_129562 [Dreissena polymorpha]
MIELECLGILFGLKLYHQWDTVERSQLKWITGANRKANSAAPSDEPAPKQNRLAMLIAEANSQYREVLSAPANPTQKPDGTCSATLVTETGSVSEESNDGASILSTSNFGDGPSTSTAADISLGLFLTFLPTLDQNTINKIGNGEFVDFPSLIYKDQSQETTTIHNAQSSTITSTLKASQKQLKNIHHWNEGFQFIPTFIPKSTQHQPLNSSD